MRRNRTPTTQPTTTTTVLRTFVVIDTATGNVADYATTWASADRVAHYLTATTRRLHIVREARA